MGFWKLVCLPATESIVFVSTISVLSALLNNVPHTITTNWRHPLLQISDNEIGDQRMETCKRSGKPWKYSKPFYVGDERHPLISHSSFLPSRIHSLLRWYRMGGTIINHSSGTDCGLVGWNAIFMFSCGLLSAVAFHRSGEEVLLEITHPEVVERQKNCHMYNGMSWGIVTGGLLGVSF